MRLTFDTLAFAGPVRFVARVNHIGDTGPETVAHSLCYSIVGYAIRVVAMAELVRGARLRCEWQQNESKSRELHVEGCLLK